MMMHNSVQTYSCLCYSQ